jgi:hypothetical protein
MTPLHYSANNGRLEVVRFFVESKADVAVKSPAWGVCVLQPSPLSPSFTHYLPCSIVHKTALGYAIMGGQAAVVAYLRSIGARE